MGRAQEDTVVKKLVKLSMVLAVAAVGLTLFGEQTAQAARWRRPVRQRGYRVSAPAVDVRAGRGVDVRVGGIVDVQVGPRVGVRAGRPVDVRVGRGWRSYGRRYYGR